MQYHDRECRRVPGGGASCPEAHFAIRPKPAEVEVHSGADNAGTEDKVRKDTVCARRIDEFVADDNRGFLAAGCAGLEHSETDK